MKRYIKSSETSSKIVDGLINEIKASEAVSDDDNYNPYSFMVGDQLEWSGLYGGEYKGVVTNVTDEYITVDVMWTAEDTGDTVTNTRRFEIATDPEGRECIIVYRYRDTVGYVYPPSNSRSSKDATFKTDKRLSPTSERYNRKHSVTSSETFDAQSYAKQRKQSSEFNKWLKRVESAILRNDTTRIKNIKESLMYMTSSQLSNKLTSYLIDKLNSALTTSSDDIKSSSYGGAFDIEDDQYSAWRELASKSVEDSDGFYTDYTLYTDGQTYICMFGDKNLYEPDASYADYETESEQDAWDWFNSYTGFADEEDEEYEYYDILESNNVKSSRKIHASWNYYPYALYSYTPGDAETGIEGDKFDIIDVVKSADEDEAKRYFKSKRMWYPNTYVDRISEDDYNAFLKEQEELARYESAVKSHNGSADEVINSSYSPDLLNDLVNYYRPFDTMSSEEIWDEIVAEYNNEDLANDVLESLDDHDEEGAYDVYSSSDIRASMGRYDEYYGQTAAATYGDLIADRLKGRAVSKRRDTANEPGGLIYEANKLGIDMWDLLEALEGMCSEGRAREIDDSTYKILGASDLADEEDLPQADQEYDSAKTSINSNKLPAIYHMITLPEGSVGIDYGGGKFDNAVEALAEQGVTLYVYDPYNRSQQHNRAAIKALRANGGADFAINSNVLNVIKEPEARLNVLENIKKITKPGAPIYITVYEGSGKGNEGVTKSGYQLNRKTADYLEEIQQVFPNAKRRGKLIVATNRGSANSSTDIKASSEIIWDDLDWSQQIEVMKRYIRNYKGARIFEDFADYINKPVEDIIDSFSDAEYRGDIRIPERMQLDSEYRNDDIYSSSSVDVNTDEYSRVDASSRTVNSSTNIKASSTEGYVYTYCDECGKKNRVKVVFNSFNEPFNDTEYKCKYCGTRNLLTDPHSYDENGNVVEASQSYLDRIEELMEQGLDEETASREAYAEFYPDDYDADDYDEIYSATTSSSRYWYFTRHGVQPGSVPKYINILDIVDTPEGSYFLADGVILTDDLRNYEIKERKPKNDVVEESKSTKGETVEAGYYDIPEPPIDPPEDDSWTEVDGWIEDVDLDVDAIIEVLDDGSWIYEDETYPWAVSKDSYNGDHYSYEYYVHIGDPGTIVEDFDDVIEKYIPSEEGRYHLKCKATLKYFIEGVEVKQSDYYDEEVYKDNASVEFDEYDSKVENVSVERIW